MKEYRPAVLYFALLQYESRCYGVDLDSFTGRIVPQPRTGPIFPEIGSSPFNPVISDTSMRVESMSDQHRYTFTSAPALIDNNVVPVRKLSQRGEIQ